MPCPRTQQANLPACSPQPPINAERQAGKLCIPFFKVFWYDSTRGLSPRSTDCEADALTTTPLRRLTIVNNWTSAGLLVSRAKDAINVEDLVPDLVKINYYRTLAANAEFLEGSVCTITEAYGLLKNMQFDDDPCAITNYIKKQLSNYDLETIINSTNLANGPTSYALLQKAQPNSAAVERSFSMLSKLLRKDRNFDVKNLKKIYDAVLQ